MEKIVCPCCCGSMTQYASDICEIQVECDFCPFACCFEHLPSLRASREAYNALPDDEKLDTLANWIDLNFPGDEAPEVQVDLRRWARNARAARAAVDALVGEG